MFYNNYLQYKNHYSKDIKKIRYKSHFYNLDKQKEDIKIKEMAGNFDLFFNREGQLCESITYKNKSIHAKFYYIEDDEENNLYMVDESVLGNDLTETISEFCYDFKNRIALQKIYNLHDEMNIQITTVYFENKKIEFYDNINDETYSGYDVSYYENDVIVQHTKYNKERKIISNSKYINELDNSKVCEFIDEKYECENIFDSRGLLIESIFSINGNKTHRKYEYVFNEKNDWITRMVTDNGKPKFVTDREIEYYHSKEE